MATRTVYVMIGVLASCSGSKVQKKQSSAAVNTRCQPMGTAQGAGWGQSGSATNQQGGTWTSPNGSNQAGNAQFGSGSGFNLQDGGQQITWLGRIKAISDQKCLSCHQASNASHGVDLSSYQSARNHLDDIAQSVADGSMPPPASAALLTDEQEAFNAWKIAGYPEGNTANNGGTTPMPGGGTTPVPGVNDGQWNNPAPPQSNYNSGNANPCPPGYYDSWATGSGQQLPNGSAWQQQNNTGFGGNNVPQQQGGSGWGSGQ